MIEPTICYVHGAGASARSFAYIKHMLPKHDFIDFEYNLDKPLDETISDCVGVINKGPITMIGHSLGGLIALSAAHLEPKVCRVVTMCTPFAGSLMAESMRWFNSSPLFEALRPSGQILTNIRTKPLPCPVFCFVATSGLPLLREDNDGVVTVESQMALKDASYSQYDLNHFEMLMDHDVCTHLGKIALHPTKHKTRI